jgi:hypothetical protein
MEIGLLQTREEHGLRRCDETLCVGLCARVCEGAVNLCSVLWRLHRATILLYYYTATTNELTN